jgi:hypothetical protein
MKKLLSTLVILMAIIVAGIHAANAQISITVGWTQGCSDTCTTQQICAYEVAYEMYYICDHHQDLICSGSDTISCSLSSVVFPCNYRCEDHTSEKCYLISATATKYCIGPPHGYLVKCTGRGSDTFSCDAIMQDLGEVTIIWDN